MGLRLAIARLVASPLFAIFSVVSLAAGVAVTTAVYSVVDTVLLADSGVADPDRAAVVLIPGSGRAQPGSVSDPDFEDLRRAQSSFSSMTATAAIAPSVAAGGMAEIVSTEAVDGAYFLTLGIGAVVGRVIQTADHAGAARVAVLSDEYWRSRLAADPAIVGREIRINRQPFVVIGVAAPRYRGAFGTLRATRLWIPLSAEAQLGTTRPSASPPREQRRLLVFGRLAEGHTIEGASAELSTIAAGLDRAFPSLAATSGGDGDRGWSAKSIAAFSEDDNSLRRFGMTLVALAGLVLLVACTNLTLDIRTALAAGATGIRPRVGRQRMVIRWQVAIAAGFFIVATLFIRATINQARHDPGIDLDRVAVAVLNFDNGVWDEHRVRRAIDRVIEESRGDPAIEATAASTGLPFGVPALQVSVAHPDDIDGLRRPYVTAVAATPSLFRTLGIEIARGRAFNDNDGTLGPPAVIVSELSARQLFGPVDPVGRTLVVRRQSAADVSAVVVGVARDTDVRWIYTERRPLIYLPLAQHWHAAITLTARSTGSAERAVPALREAIRRADPDLSVTALGAGPMLLAGPFMFVRSLGRGALYLGGLSLLLSMAGLFGVQSHVVAHRTREIGVRMSIGATAGRIKLMVLKDGYRPVVEGLVLGLWGGIAGRIILRRYMELEDVAIFDPWLLLLTPVPLLAAAFWACYLPAAKAASVDPTVALRCE